MLLFGEHANIWACFQVIKLRGSVRGHAHKFLLSPVERVQVVT
jgi:hypothetical protein